MMTLGMSLFFVCLFSVFHFIAYEFEIVWNSHLQTFSIDFTSSTRGWYRRRNEKKFILLSFSAIFEIQLILS